MANGAELYLGIWHRWLSSHPAAAEEIVRAHRTPEFDQVFDRHWSTAMFVAAELYVLPAASQERH